MPTRPTAASRTAAARRAADGPHDAVPRYFPAALTRRRMRREVSRVRVALRAIRTRRRQLEAHLERRFPALYDSRHAARGFWPLVGPLITGVLLIPVVA